MPELYHTLAFQPRQRRQSFHIHLLAALSKTRSVSDALRDIKANSSGWIHDHFPAMRGFAWQTGYAAFTVSYSLIGSVRDYLAGQEEHHRLTTSREELIAFLVRHQIPYDPRYLDEGEFTG